jgi:hypothetical protein
MSRNQCLLRYGWCSCDLYSRCTLWFPCISTQPSALCRTEGCNLSKIPGVTWISWQTFSVHCCNTSRGWVHQSLSMSPPPKMYRIQVRGLCRPVDWASMSYPLFMESLVQMLSDNAEKIRWCPIMHESHVLSLMKRHMLQEYWKIIHQKMTVHCTC